jgi:alpha-beta hydrolase superfamily lysophospholipase
MRTTGLLISCALLIVLSGCSSVDVAVSDTAPQRYLPPGAIAEGSSIDAYQTADGSELAYVHYSRTDARTALVYLHGIESHAGWFALAAEALQAKGFDVFCLDRRGSGMNRENRGFPSGHVDSFETLHEDIRAFLSEIDDRYESIYLVGLSWGGKLALSYTLAHPADADGLVLITPGLRSVVTVPLVDKLRITAAQGLNPTLAVATPIEPEMFTTTPAYLDYIRNDPLRLQYASARFFWESNRLDRFVDERMAGDQLPILLFLAGRDRIIDNDGVLEVLAADESPDLDVFTYEDQTHSIQLDAVDGMVEDITGWLSAQGAAE